jgi:hypothetical protein
VRPRKERGGGKGEKGREEEGRERRRRRGRSRILERQVGGEAMGEAMGWWQLSVLLHPLPPCLLSAARLLPVQHRPLAPQLRLSPSRAPRVFACP